MSEEQVQLKTREHEIYTQIFTHRDFTVTFRMISNRKCLSFILQKREVCEIMQEAPAASLRRQFIFYSAVGHYLARSDTT